MTASGLQNRVVSWSLLNGVAEQGRTRPSEGGKKLFCKVQYNHKQQIKEFYLNVRYSFAVHSAYIYVYKMFSAGHWRRTLNYKVPVVNISIYWLVTGTLSVLSCLVLHYRDHYTRLGSTQTTSPRSQSQD